MDTFVRLEMSTLPEGHSTRVTLVGLLARVHPHVRLQDELEAEILLADVTFEGFLARVCSQVILMNCCGIGDFAAEGADADDFFGLGAITLEAFLDLIRALFRWDMSEFVEFEVHLGLEALPADIALEFDFRVDIVVGFESCDLGKALAADCAEMIAEFFMNILNVTPEILFGGVDLIAMWTDIFLGSGVYHAMLGEEVVILEALIAHVALVGILPFGLFDLLMNVFNMPPEILFGGIFLTTNWADILLDGRMDSLVFGQIVVILEGEFTLIALIGFIFPHLLHLLMDILNVPLEVLLGGKFMIADRADGVLFLLMS